MSFINQFEMQHKYAFGRILNCGCDVDSSNFRGRGAVNVDIWKHNPYTGRDLPVDVLADARHLSRDLDGKPTGFHGCFDTVILGDILEHFVERADVLGALAEAVRCLAPGGRIILTCPEDHRTPAEAGLSEPYPMYGEGVRAYHAYPVTLDIMRAWCRDAGLTIIAEAHIAYQFLPQTGGWGVVAVPAQKESEAV